MRGIRYDPERRKGSTLLRRTDLFATLARLAAACLAVAFALLLVPEKAYAVTYGDVIYGPTAANGPTDSTSYYVQVYAFDRYTAALGALGYNPRDSRFTSDVKAYLSNSSTGGAFYDFAQQFTDSPYENDGGSVVGGTVGVDVEDFGMYTAYRQNVNLYGSNVWWANYTITQSLAARTSVGLVLAGNIAGGGGSGGGSGLSVQMYPVFSYRTYGATDADKRLLHETFTVDGVTYTTRMEMDGTGYGSNTLISSPFLLSIPDLELPDLPTGYTTDDIMVAFQSTSAINLYLGHKDVSLASFTTNSSSGSSKTFQYYSGTQTYSYTLQIQISNVTCTSAGMTVANYRFDRNYWGSYSGTKTYGLQSGDVGFAGTYSSGSTTPTPPPTNWPTDPTPNPPTEPTVPNPPTYGTPTQPTIPGPTADPVYGNQTIYITNNFTADFQGIIDALDEHCRHLQNALYNNMSDFYTKLTTKMTNDFSTLRSFLHGQFGWLGDGMVDIADDMMDYLHDLFVWLADQFDFSVSGGGYDDNTVVAWLKKIYSKLGGGVNTRPTDPVSDPIGFGDWLNQLLQNFVLDLLAMGQNVLADLVESFRELITKFPFSIPWDIATFLALLVAEPVAPSIDWPMYTVSGGSLVQVATCEIDLEDYDSIMGGVRAMETLLFACWLAFKIDFFKGVVSGIGGNK